MEFQRGGAATLKALFPKSRSLVWWKERVGGVCKVFARTFKSHREAKLSPGFLHVSLHHYTL